MSGRSFMERIHALCADVEYVDPNRFVVGTCPVCGEEVVRAGRTYTCSSNKSTKDRNGNWRARKGCGFTLFPFCGKVFSPQQAEELLRGGMVSLEGCKNKEGKVFSCRVSLDGTGKVVPTFEDSRLHGRYRGKRHR